MRVIKIMQSLLLVALAGPLMVVGSGSARADGDPIEVAKREFEEGKAAFERGEYESSVEHFVAAQRIAPAPSLTYNLGLVYERMGRFTDAANTFDKYLEELPAPSSKDERQFRDNLKQRSKSNRLRAQSKPTAPANPVPPPPTSPPPRASSPPPPTAAPNTNPPRTSASPPSATPPPNYYGDPPNYYAGYPTTNNPYGFAYPIMQKSPQDKLSEARDRRGRAIALITIGSVLNIVGIGVLSFGLTTDRWGGHKTSANVALDFAGVSFMVVGITLWAPGASSFVSSSKDMAAAQRELDKQERGPARQPTTFLFQAPTLQF